jgi:hypothetical protein
LLIHRHELVQINDAVPVYLREKDHDEIRVERALLRRFRSGASGTGSIVFCEFTGSRGYGCGMSVSATITAILRYLRCSSFFDSMMPSKRASTR